MTISVHVLHDLLRRDQREDFRVTYSKQTPRQIRDSCKLPHWENDEVVVSVLGRTVEGEELDRVLSDGADVTLVPRITGLTVGAVLLFLVKAAAAAIVSVAISYALAKLQGRPKPPQVRGDVESPTYGWEGMTTGYGVGARVGLLYGIHAVPGQVISSTAFQLSSGDDDVLSVTLAIGAGPVSKIAGVDLLSRTEWNDLGGLYNRHPLDPDPSGIRVNNNLLNVSDVNVSLRAGTDYQTPLPGPARSFSAYDVAYQVPQLPGGTHTTSAYTPHSADIVGLRARIRVDAWYGQSSGGTHILTGQFTIAVYTGRVGGSPFIGSATGPVISKDTRTSFRTSVEIALPPGGDATGYVAVVSWDGNSLPGTSLVVTAEWVGAVEEIRGDELAFPGIALANIELRATERLSGSQPNFQVECWGRPLRWKLAGVWQDATFHDTGTGKWIGRNPAWVLYDFLTSQDGLGRWISSDMIDEDSFEEWAEYCDELVDDGASGTHPRHHFDGMIDRGAKAWEIVLQIARCGRAVPWFFDNLYRIKFEHPDSVAFPRPVRQLFAESNIEDLTISYPDKLDRPNILEAQILNEDLSYEQDVISQEDPDSGINSPYSYRAEPPKSESIEFFGITRPAHARRELAWMLATNRLSYSQIDFSCGIYAWAAEIGDLIAVQHDVPNWFDTATGGFRTTRASAAAASIYLDHAVTLQGGHTYAVAVVEPTNDDLQIVTITSVAGTYAADTALTLASAIDCRKGAVISFGELDNVVKTYQVTSIEHDGEWKFRIGATLYDEAAFDAETAVPTAESSDPPASEAASTESPTEIASLAVVRSKDGRSVRLTFGLPGDTKGRVRIWVRSVVDSDPVADSVASYSTTSSGRWDLVYEGREAITGPLDLVPLQTYEAVGAVETSDGEWSSPDSCTVHQVTPEEFPPFPPAQVPDLTAAQCGDGVLLSWTPLREDAIDYYEVRRGTGWLGCEVVARTQRSAFLVADMPVGEQTYEVCARHHNGLYSGEVASVTITTEAPASWSVEAAATTDIDPSLGGTATDVELDADGTVVLSSGKLHGTYVSPTLDAGSAAARYWSVLWSGYVEDVGTTVADLADIEVGSGEASWRRVAGREPTWWQPGGDFATDMTSGMHLDADWRVAGPPGAVGHHARILAEMALDPGTGVFGDWQPLRSGPQVAARKLKVRWTFDRIDESWQVHLLPSVALSALDAAPVSPGGAAGGDLDGSYPDPEVVALTTSTPERLPIGPIAEGAVLVRVSSTITSLPASTWIVASPGQVSTTYLADDAVTFAKMQNVSTDTLVGRDSSGTGDPESLSVGGGVEFTGSGGIQRSALTGDVTASAGSASTTIANNAVTNAKLADIATDTLVGRDTAGTGDPEAISVGGGVEFSGSGGIRRSALTGDVTASAGSNTTTVAAIRGATITTAPSGANQLLAGDAVDGSTLAWVAIGTSLAITTGVLQRAALTGDVTASANSNATTIANDAVTLAKMANLATDKLIGRDTAGTGDPEALDVSGGLEFSGSGGIRRSALTGDVTASAGSNSTTIANDAVTDAKLRNSTALSVIGRAANSTGDPADIAATAAGDGVLRESGGTVGFGTIRLGAVFVPTNEVCDPHEFLDGVARVTPYGGSGGWTYAIDGTSGHPGQIRVDSSGTSGGSAGFYSPSSLILAAGTSIEFVFYVGNDATGTIVRIGLSDSTSGTADPTNGVFVEYSKAVSANIRYRARKASVSTDNTSGTAFALSAWKKVRLSYDGTNATFEYGSSGGSYSTLGTISAANLPTAAIRPWFFVTQSAAAAYTYADVDLMWPRMWSLAR